MSALVTQFHRKLTQVAGQSVEAIITLAAGEIDAGLAGSEFNGALHGAVIGKEVLQHIVGGFGVLNAAICSLQ